MIRALQLCIHVLLSSHPPPFSGQYLAYIITFKGFQADLLDEKYSILFLDFLELSSIVLETGP